MLAPSRSSLIFGAAESLKKAIENEEFPDVLPNVRILSEMLCVSVPTVVAAVKILVRDRYVVTRQGCPTKVVYSGHLKQVPVDFNPRKIVLAGFGLEILSASSRYRNLADQLLKLDFEVELKQFTEKTWRQNQECFSHQISKDNVACWVLVEAPPSVQKWFSERNLPCLVSSGVSDPQVALPDFEIDFSALYRHCANQMLNLGHEHILLLLEERSAAKNPQSIAAFVETVQARFPEAAENELVKTHDGTNEDCQRVLEQLFDQDIKPTGLCVAWVDFYILAQTWLQAQSYRIPGDVSLISRDSNVTSFFLRPRPAHYRISLDNALRRMVRTILAVVEQTSIAEHTLILPEFIDGESLAAPRP